MKDFAEALVQPELRGYVDTPVGLLRLVEEMRNQNSECFPAFLRLG